MYAFVYVVSGGSNYSYQVLMNHIRDKLPDMKARLNTLMGQAQQELNSFGDSAIFGDKNQVSRGLNAIGSRRLHSVC